jgi:hypothetical protein
MQDINIVKKFSILHDVKLLGDNTTLHVIVNIKSSNCQGCFFNLGM